MKILRHFIHLLKINPVTMKMSLKILLFLTVSLIFMGSCQQDKPPRLPNIIYILADDLGYGEIGVYGQQKIQTPNLDALAASGMRFTDHYSGAPVCAPARCILLTGKHAGHAYIRGNDEWGSRGEVWNYTAAVEDSSLEGQRPIPEETLTIAELLRDRGYRTGIVGKWGLGAPGSEGVPGKQGFDYFFGYNCQRQAHNLYPPFLWENDTKIWYGNDIVAPGTPFPEGGDPDDPENYSVFRQKDYAPEKMHEKALEFIRESGDKPFFLYYASPLPHLPLQVPEEYVDRYRVVFGEEEPYTGRSYFPNQFPRATYAGMISMLDDQVGDLVKVLKEHGLYENTLIMFASDNGPSYVQGVDFEFFQSSAPFSNGYGRTKGFTYEGGIRVPFIVHWPGMVKAGSVSEHVSAFYDIFPTLCEITGIEKSQYESDGISLLPELTGGRQEAHEYLYWEFPSYGGQQAVRLGKWKGIRKNILDGNMALELYDLGTDKLEANDLSSEYPEIIRKIEMIMQNAREVPEVDRFKMPPLGDG
jgi:arylsulfatase